jgi:beta-lactam-binding protein with PASTA domain
MKPLRHASRVDLAARRRRAPGGGMVTVPNLVGLRFQRAIRVVRRAGLRQTEPGFSGSLSNPHLTGQPDRISSQSPPPGMRVARGTTIAIHEAIRVRPRGATQRRG